MCKVNLLVLGEQKCGTTALKYNLNKHPDINFIIRELHIFDTNNSTNIYNRFIKSNTKYNGEGTPIYFYQPDCISKILKYNPDMKFLVILRDPVKRFVSSHNMFIEKGIEKDILEETINKQIQQYHNNIIVSKKFIDGSARHYLRRGFYIDQINYLLQFINRDNLHIIISEKLWTTPQKELEELYQFLDIPYFELEYEQKHERKYKKTISVDMENKLKDIYSKTNKQLEDFLSIKLPWL